MHIYTYLQPLINFLHLHPQSAGIITFFVVFAEAMAVIGVVVPGSVTMTAVGVLIGTSVIPAGTTFAWAIAGAILGDILSHWLGTHYQDRLHRIWPFSKHPQLLEKSEEFFKKHGGKSVFLGRFIGPMRAMVPMVAGMFKMPLGKFLIAAIPSASMWAVGYIMPGVILGALSLELPPKVATQFLLAALAIILAVWAATWLTHSFAKRIYCCYDRYVMQSWFFMRQRKSLRWFTTLLADPREPDNHQQLSLFLLVIVSVAIFAVVLTNVMMNGILTTLNNPLYHLLQSLRTPLLDYGMVAITLLGEDKFLIGASFLLLVWLAYKRYWYVAIHWLAIIVMSAGAIGAMKTLFFSHRPDASHQLTSSFPSGHTLLSSALMGFWAVIVAREITTTEKRKLVYCGSLMLVLLIALSRLYLGEHWLTDVVGSFLLGVALVLLLTISYRRRHTQDIDLRQFIKASALIFFATIIGYGFYTYPNMLRLNTPIIEEKSITRQDWENAIGKDIPIYRLNRLGKPIQAFNVEWIGELGKIEQVLLDGGWEKQPLNLDLHDVILSLAGDSTASHIPIFPQLYHNRPMKLLMMKKTEEDHTAIVLRLWQSDITEKTSGLPLWLGAIDYHYAERDLFKITHKKLHGEAMKSHKFIGATDALNGSLEGFKWKKVVYPREKQPEEMQYLDWKGLIFLVSPK